jgi:hypothetical protein
MPGPLIFGEPGDECGKAGFVVFTIEPSPMPTPKRILRGKFKEATVRASPKTHTSDNLTVLDAQLVL